MDSTIVTTLIFVGSYLALELICFLVTRKSFAISITEHVVQTILNVSKEIVSEGKSKRFCGIVVAIQVIVFLAGALYLLHNTFLHGDVRTLIVLSVIIVLLVPVILLPSWWINTRFVSWCDKS